MDEIITYGVFYRSKNSRRPDKWFMFCGWFTEYETAQQIASTLRTNGQCTAVKVVEREETFEDVPGTLWERKINNRELNYE